MSEHKSNRKNIVISNKYGRGQDYMDNIEGFDDLDVRNDYNDVSNTKNKEFTLRIFPDPDW